MTEQEKMSEMSIEEAVSALRADKEYLVDKKVCDGEEIDVAIEALKFQQAVKECLTEEAFNLISGSPEEKKRGLTE